MLSEWLVRAYSLQKRQAKGYKGGSAQYEDPTSRTSPGADSSGGGGKEAGGIGASPSPDADLLAREVDHYTVLGVRLGLEPGAVRFRVRVSTYWHCMVFGVRRRVLLPSFVLYHCGEKDTVLIMIVWLHGKGLGYI